MKPLFIPLKTEYFEAFRAGTKTVEYRHYGPRWNGRTCVVGRPVVLSKGYGTAARLTGHIVSFDVGNVPPEAREAWLACYGADNHLCARIGVALSIAGEQP